MGFLDFLKGVGQVFSALARLIPNFPKFVICLVKLIVISVIHMLLLIPGIDHVVTFLIHLRRYLISLVVKLVFPILMFLFVAIVALIDVILGDFSGNDTLGARMHRILSLFNTCLNDPRGWFTVRRWHRHNRYTRLFGVYPCMSPCFPGYEPEGMSGGMLCKKMSVESPEFCTAAAITRVAEGMPYRPLPFVSVSADDCRTREAAQLSENQKLLVRTVCQQPDEYDNEFLRVPCFERYCAYPSSDDVGPSTCVNLVPYKSRKAPVHQQLVMIVLLLVTGAQFFFTMVTSIRAKQDEFVQLNQSFMQDKLRVDS